MSDEYTCSICGKRETGFAVGSVASSFKIDPGPCFNCGFWLEKIRGQQEGKRVVVVEGSMYVICGEGAKRCIKGFNGRRWRIHYLGGRTIETTNLHHLGKIPKHFREQLPDDAEFVR